MLGVDASSLRGAGMVVLQILRAFTVISLAVLATTCWIFIINVDKEKEHFVAESASYAFTSFFCIALMLSEYPLVGPVRRWFRNNCAIFSDRHGLKWLGLAVIVLGVDMLGTLGRPAFEGEALGPHFSKLVRAAPILALVFGSLNTVADLVWHEHSQGGVGIRHVRANGSLAQAQRDSLPDYASTAESAKLFASDKAPGKLAALFSKKAKADKARPSISGPMPPQPDLEQQYGHADDRRSPIVPGIKRPDTALHPMHVARESVYSAANISRF